MGVLLTGNLRRNFWVVPLATLLTCAVLLATTVSHVLETLFLLDAQAAPARPAARRPRAPAPARTKDTGELIARNMFCSTCEPGQEAPPVVAGGEPAGSTLPLVLVATARSAGGAPEAATLANTATGRTGSYAVGDVLTDIGPIRRIGAQSVDVYNEKMKRVERVGLVAKPAPAVAAAAPPPSASPSSSSGPPADEGGVKQVAENSFVIERSLVDQTLANPTAIMTSARVLPVTENGQARGFRLAGIRTSSLLARMGLKNGDQIRAINGYELTSPDRALEAYTKLRSATNLSLAVTRQGAPVNLEYAIR